MARKSSLKKDVIKFPSNRQVETDSAPSGGVVIGLGGYFFWYAGTDDTISEKRKRAAELTDPANERDRDHAWYDAALFYNAYDLVTLARFLRDFELYSKSILGPKTPQGRAARNLGYANPAEESRIAEIISERRGVLIESIRNAAFDDAAFVFSGRKFIADASYGETRFEHTILDIQWLFYWLVNDSGLEADWIPFHVREWVKNNPLLENELPQSPPQHETPLTTNKRRVGRPRYSPNEKAKEREYYQGWVRFRDSKAGSVKDYVNDLADKGIVYTVDDFKKLIERRRKDKPSSRNKPGKNSK